MNLETVQPCWRDEPVVVVAAPGPSLSEEVAEQCRGHRTVAVGNAYKLMPWADVVYHTDGPWWTVHKGCPGFAGRRWSSHDSGNNSKAHLYREIGLRLIAGENGNEFSLDPSLIRYGSNSLFAAVNLAILFGGRRIVMVGVDMRRVDGKVHFDGDHPKPLRNPSSFATFIRAFVEASKALPAGVSIVNATPGSDLRCFPMVPLVEALAERMAA